MFRKKLKAKAFIYEREILGDALPDLPLKAEAGKAEAVGLQRVLVLHGVSESFK